MRFIYRFSEFKKSNKVFENVLTKKIIKEETIDGIQNGQNVRLRGLIVQLFPVRYYNLSECRKKLLMKMGLIIVTNMVRLSLKKRYFKFSFR